MGFFTTVQEFLGKFDTVTWNKGNRTKGSIEGTLPTGDIVTFSLRTEFAQSHHDFKRLPVQVVARVEINGEHAMTYGSDSNEMNSQLVEFFVRNEAVASRVEYDMEKVARNRAEEIYNSL